MIENWNGYLVVASPDSRYRGADRDPWGVLGDSFYDGTLSSEVERAYQALRDANLGFWWPTAHDPDTANALLAATQDISPDAELIVVYSPYLHRLGHASWTDSEVTSIGFDVVAVGEWSLLAALAESGVEVPHSMNVNGLLAHADVASSVESLYRRSALLDQVEAIAEPDPRIPVEAVRVGVLT